MIEVGEGWEDVGFDGEAAEEDDGVEAVGREGVVDVVGQVVADGFGWEGDAWGPLGRRVFDVGEAMVAGLLEVGDELRGGDGER